MHAMIPCNLALIAIATLFYTWRDVHVPKRISNERVAKLLWAAASDHDAERIADSHSLEVDSSQDDLEEEPDETGFALYRGVECRACQGTHSFHYAGKSRRAGSTFEFTCPVVKKNAWIWWLDKIEHVDELPADVVLLDWIQG